MSWLNAWTPYFQGQDREQGRTFCQGGQVRRVVAENGELARFEVTEGEQAQLVSFRPDVLGATVSCDCDQFASGSYCCHIWASLSELSAKPTGDDDSFEDIGDVRPRPPKAKKRAGGSSTARQSEPQWMRALNLLRMTGDDGDSFATMPIQRQVCYILDVELSQRRQSLVIELRQRQPTASGWGKPRSLRINSQVVSELTEPEDRELCSLILGATWAEEDDSVDTRTGIFDRARSRFRLQSGAGRTIIYRMIQTGRCFIEYDDELAELQWDARRPSSDDDLEDDTWVLWLFGMDTPTTLDLSLEIRRRGQRVPINEPVLLLGGQDGLVINEDRIAPFDDRNAYRWIGQLHDDLTEERASDLKIPLEEVPRFLDRLYTLTQLPEIDLPEGIGKDEQRIKPRPTIDIYSPDHATRGNGNGKSRGQLTAVVRFAYGDTVVNPSDAGRFVSSVAVPSESAADDAVSPETQNETASQEATVDGEETTPSSTVATIIDQAPPDTTDHAIEPIADDSKLIRRDRSFERHALLWLLTIGLRQSPGDGQVLTMTTKQMGGIVAQLLARGWQVRADERMIRQSGPPRLSVTSGMDWFELRGTVRFQTDNGNYEIGLPQLLAAARSGRTMIDLGDGTQGLLPQEWLEEHGLLTAIGALEDDHLRFKGSQAALLDTLLRRQELVSVDDRFEAAREQLKKFDGIKPVTPLGSFNGSLRPYQEEALGWFNFLRWFGMGGILADDMGLGKTVQVLAMLDTAYSANGSPEQQTVTDGQAKRRPTLIVAPRSVVFNWVDESERFAPNLRVQVYSGADREVLREAFSDHEIIITSYGLMRRDIAELQHHAFEYVVLDEAQAIKNPSSQSAKAARLLNANYRLALTGTPVENHLGDLWSIFEFLNPGMLGSSTRFANLVRGSNGSNGNGESKEESAKGKLSVTTGSSAAIPVRDVEAPKQAQVAVQVASALRPFILRRTKTQVLTDLPAKTEQTIVCEMEPAQRQLYDELRQYYRGALLNRAGTSGTGLGGSAIMVLEALLRLRQAACHPGLIDQKRAGEPSAKLEALTDSLVELIEEGHKALVFSQFVEMLSLVRTRLDDLGIKYEYLDGQTRDRKRRVDHFQSDPDCSVFLISLKAGGLGLNLTAAEYVFILDPWWNPAVEQQAIDRTHRIGQTQPVFAYRLICSDTVEQRIAQLQSKKRKLADAIVGGENNLLANLTREELEELLS